MGPILFLIYINDLPDICESRPGNTKIFLYDDDAKVYDTITSDEDQKNLQSVINKLKEWCDQWSLPLNISKCCHMSLYTSKNISDTTYHIHNNTILCKKLRFMASPGKEYWNEVHNRPKQMVKLVYAFYFRI